MAMETKLVRLKPYNKKKGHILRRYTYRGLRFQGARGWYRVNADVAAYLAKVNQIPGDVDSPLAFDVCTESEAKEIDKLEAHHARGALPAEEATDATVMDVDADDEVEDEGEPPPTDAGDLSTSELPQNQKRTKPKRSRKSA